MRIEERSRNGPFAREPRSERARPARCMGTAGGCGLGAHPEQREALGGLEAFA
jgi:hypothetical protein